MLAPRQLTVLHRRQQAALRRATIAELNRLWPTLDWADLDGTYPGFAARVLQLVARNRDISTGLSATYLRAFRAASGLSGDAPIVPVVLDPVAASTSLRVTTVVPAKRASAQGTAPDVAMGAALTLAAGAVSRLVLSGGRDTIMRSLREDDRVRGYVRILAGNGCEFCRSLAGRHSSIPDSFHAHDGCSCYNEPVYGA